MVSWFEKAQEEDSWDAAPSESGIISCHTSCLMRRARFQDTRLPSNSFLKRTRARAHALPDAGSRGFLMRVCCLVSRLLYLTSRRQISCCFRLVWSLFSMANLAKISRCSEKASMGIISICNIIQLFLKQQSFAVHIYQTVTNCALPSGGRKRRQRCGYLTILLS